MRLVVSQALSLGEAMQLIAGDELQIGASL